jgi:hypothetical protein
VIELYVVGPGEDDAFRAAFEQDAPAGHTLYRALRDDTPHRFASIDGPRRHGAVLIARWDDAALHAFEGHQGFLGVERHGELGLVRWSSPLMYARATSSRGALYIACS